MIVEIDELLSIQGLLLFPYARPAPSPGRTVSTPSSDISHGHVPHVPVAMLPACGSMASATSDVCETSTGCDSPSSGTANAAAGSMVIARAMEKKKERNLRISCSFQTGMLFIILCSESTTPPRADVSQAEDYVSLDGASGTNSIRSTSLHMLEYIVFTLRRLP